MSPGWTLSVKKLFHIQHFIREHSQTHMLLKEITHAMAQYKLLNGTREFLQYVNTEASQKC